MALYSQETAQKNQYRDYQPIGFNFALRTQDVQSSRLILVEPVAPMTPLQKGQVLAMNKSRALVTFESNDAGEQGQQGQLLALVDTSSKQFVWRKPMRDIPQLAQRSAEMQLQADPAGNGFYLRNGYVTPLLLIDNDGKTLYDFVEGRSSDNGRTRSGAPKKDLKNGIRNLFM